MPSKIVHLREFPAINLPILRAIDQAHLMLDGVDLWLRDGGFEAPEEAIRRLRLMRAWCRSYAQLYAELEEEMNAYLRDPGSFRLQ